jgi:hypothetical protein
MSLSNEDRSTYVRLSDVDEMKKLDRLVPGAGARMFDELERHARYLRRRSYILLVCAMVIFFSSAATSVVLALHNLAVTGSILAAGGSLTTVRILLLGQARTIRPQREGGLQRLRGQSSE